MLLLQMLSQKDMYGYEMIETLSERSNNVFELKVGTLYPLLHGLVQSGYLTCYEEEVNGKVRKYYQITPNGRIYHEKMCIRDRHRRSFRNHEFIEHMKEELKGE